MKIEGIMKKFNAVLAIAGLFSVIMMTGCWDDAEINGRAFVLGFGADTGSEGYRFTFQLAIPVSGGSDSSGSISYTARSVNEQTPAAAVGRLEKDLGRQINFEQLSLIVIGENLSREKFTGLTDYFFRRASVRRQSCIAVCRGSAERFFLLSATDKAVAVEAASALQSYDAGGGKISMDLFSLYKTLINRDGFYLPEITCSPVSTESDSPSDGKSVILNLSGASAYSRDGYFLGKISEDELELLRLTSGSATDGAISVQDGSGNNYCCQIRQSVCSVRCEIKNDLPVFRIKLSLVLVPLDADGIRENAHQYDEFRLISGAAEDTLLNRLNAFAKRSRDSLGSSVLGLQDVIRQRQPDWYGQHMEEWEDIYPHCAVSVTVKCTVAGGGITK